MTQANGHPDQPTISGLEAHLGRGAAESRSFWVDAWAQVLRRPSAIIALIWVGVVAFFAIAAPLLASGHPLVIWNLDSEGNATSRSFPLLSHLRTSDWVLLVGGLAGALLIFLPLRAPRTTRIGIVLAAGVQAGLVTLGAQVVAGYFGARDAPQWARDLEQSAAFIPVAAALVALVVSAPFLLVPSVARVLPRAALVTLVGLVTGLIVWQSWHHAPARFTYAERIRDGEIRAVWTLVPWSPAERPGDRDAKLLPPGWTTDQALAKRVVSGLSPTDELSRPELRRALAEIDRLPLDPSHRAGLRAIATTWINEADRPSRRGFQTLLEENLRGSGRVYVLGSDAFGHDVLSQLLHACRLAISIGLVSTSIAVLIGVTLGALMGYFGGLVDLVFYRIVEIFMAIPLLFILIVAAGVLPRNTYVMMAIIGCFTWTNAARFTRAEFLRLRNQDFVQAARGVGLPLRSVLFRHMLPNAVTPVLVDASFAIAFAIILEATLSFLGLGPIDQASWGRLLADATNEVGQFLWWLAIFPGLAIFLAALSYNLIGEALRDAIDPKLKKARV